eukprot:570585-Amphidinium_carterae.2
MKAPSIERTLLSAGGGGGSPTRAEAGSSSRPAKSGVLSPILGVALTSTPEPMLARATSSAPGGPSCLRPAVGGGGERPPVPSGVAMPMETMMESSGTPAEGESIRYMVARWLSTRGD